MRAPTSSKSDLPRAAPSSGPRAEPDDAVLRLDEPTVVIDNSGKGGAGKTALGHATVHTALALGLKPVIFDFDGSNPDLWAGWPEVDADDRNAIETHSFSGWESALQTIQALGRNHVVVIDLPANTGTVAEAFLQPMMEVGGYYVTLWALDPGRKPLDALLTYDEGPTTEPIVVAKSAFKSDNGDADFDMWGRFGHLVDLRGGFTFNVPRLESAVRVAMVEGGEAVMTREDLRGDRGAWSIDRIAADRTNPLRASRARSWLARMRPEVERAMALARRLAP